MAVGGFKLEIRIVLVEPSHPGNIGATARAMKTMDLSSLYLVQPKRFPDPQADGVLLGHWMWLLQLESLTRSNDAIGDCGYVAGTSVRDRHIPWTVKSAMEFASDVATMPPRLETARDSLWSREQRLIE